MTPSELLPEEPFAFPEEATRALYAPLGAVSPLWFLFAGATGAGLAYWWATRWTRFTNLEAMFAGYGAQVEEAVEAAVEAAPSELFVAPEPVETVSPPAVTTLFDTPAPNLVPEPVEETASEPVVDAVLDPVIEAAAEPIAEAAPEPRPVSRRPARSAPSPEV